jgi:hypothetical protein
MRLRDEIRNRGILNSEKVPPIRPMLLTELQRFKSILETERSKARQQIALNSLIYRA